MELADFVLPKFVSDVLSKLSSFSFVNSVQSCHYASIIDSTSLWHSTLGHRHPSFQRLAIYKLLYLMLSIAAIISLLIVLFVPLLSKKGYHFNLLFMFLILVLI